MNRDKKRHVLYMLLVLFIFTLLLSLSFSYKNPNKQTNKVTNVKMNDPVELDNWELSTVFYDSTVDNGNTPLTEINWDASDGGYDTGETRTITVQLTIKNTNVIRDYAKNSIKISIPNLFYGELYRPNSGNSQTVAVGDYYKFLANSKVLIGANYSTHTGYDWNFITGEEPLARQKVYEFTNNNFIENRSNFEDTFKIIYTVTPTAEQSKKTEYQASELIEFGEDECFHEYDNEIVAQLKYTNNDENNIQSNSLSLHYERTYYHPWTKQTFNLEKKADQIISYDGLNDNPNDYTWVKYIFLVDNLFSSYYKTQSYPYYTVHYTDALIYEELPEGCIAFDNAGNQLEIINGKYKVDIKYGLLDNYYPNQSGYYSIMYVGYPKSLYNNENDNMNIFNTAELWGVYNNNTEEEILDTDTVNIDLKDFSYSYDGDIYTIQKKWGDSYKMTDMDISNNWGSNNYWKIAGRTRYLGNKYDLVIGDEKLLYKLNDGSIHEMTDNEYYFKTLNFNENLKNSNGDTIPKDKYDVELWIRKKGETEYTLFSEFKTGNSSYLLFTENDGVVGAYYKIKDLREGVQVPNTNYSNYIFTATIGYKIPNITETGYIYNLAYLKVYEDGILTNKKDLDTYNNDNILKNVIDYDLQKHGDYIQRSYSSSSWKKLKIPQPANSLDLVQESDSTIIQDAENEKFLGQFGIAARFQHSESFDEHYTPYYDSNYGIYGYDIYDLLPKGMELNSTPEEIINSLRTSDYNIGIYSQSPSIYDSSFNKLNERDYLNIIKSNTVIEIVKNWNNTERTRLHIKVRLDEPLYGFKGSGGTCFLSLIYLYKYSISYDSVIEYGNEWMDRAYLFNIPENINVDYSSYPGPTKDNGNRDIEAFDINGNDDSEEEVLSRSSTATITSIVSSHQAVLVQTKTDTSNYETGTVNTPLNSDYYYKIRITTGTADVTNLIIYNSLENYTKNSNQELIKAAGTRNYWQGDFLGVDTTYAESKGYNIKVYYSGSDQPGNLNEDDSWEEYNDNVDKSQVKSLAFEYLDSTGNRAILPSNTLTYVLIKMKSPNEDLKTLAYNGCWTEWNAIDPITNQPVDFITGINSNIVRVKLPSSNISEEEEYTIEKIWDDNNNILGVRPNSEKIKVIPDNDYNRMMEVTLNTSNVDENNNNNKWSKKITLDKYDENNNPVSYSFEEDDIVAGDYLYHGTVNNSTVTNSLTKKYTITKKWIDNNNNYLTRPTETTITINQNDNYYQDLTISGNYSTNEWTKDVYLPAIDSSGNIYNYTFIEADINRYSTTYDVNTLTFTNTLQENQIINIKKKWYDNSNAYNTRPDSLKVDLKQNDTNYQEITLTGDTNEWISEDIVIPKYDNNGVKYTYSIEEDSVNEDYTIIEYNQEEFTISNTLKKNILLTITKNWIDGSNSYDTRPDNLNITLLQNDNEYQDITLSGDADTWTYSLEVPKYDDNQVKYIYKIKENIDNDEYTITYDESGTSVTNTLEGTTSIEITKKWLDSDNEYNTRPEKTIVNILRNNELYKELEITNEEWKLLVDNLPVYDENGYKYTYTIEEEPLERYTKVTYDQDTYTITNELTDIPTVTLYFTLKNGYTTSSSNDIQYDEIGLNRVLASYNLNSNYNHNIKMINLETEEIYTGTINSSGVLEFKDLPYGTYKATEEYDDFFSFISMLSINNVDGIDYKENERGAIITITPTGNNIIYGLNIINKISYIAPIVDEIEREINLNPNTKTGIQIILIILFTILLATIIYYVSKRINKYTLSN